MTMDPSPRDSVTGGEPDGMASAMTAVMACLRRAKLTPPLPAGSYVIPADREGEFCTIEAVPRSAWPPGVRWVVEVVHHPDVTWRWYTGQPDRPGTSEHRAERLAVVAEVLRDNGYVVTVVPRASWRPDQRALRVHHTPATP
ncbi:hypothetical protein ACFVIM_17305 [Streptomyces sp. NPDC057638]|uniref:hypothetical protein n=1 Tax=Streptomyces sp. NPDC057638 TaxID=3346190 RepID=UPI0036A5E5E5